MKHQPRTLKFHMTQPKPESSVRSEGITPVQVKETWGALVGLRNLLTSRCPKLRGWLCPGLKEKIHSSSVPDLPPVAQLWTLPGSRRRSADARCSVPALTLSCGSLKRFLCPLPGLGGCSWYGCSKTQLPSSSPYRALPFGMKSKQASGAKGKHFLDPAEERVGLGLQFPSVLASVLYKWALAWCIFSQYRKVSEILIPYGVSDCLEI